jgi:two-component system sensor histidine kinase UhpB
VHALEWLVRQFELSGADTVMHAHLAADEQAIPAALKTVIFRICQEALNNVIKHAGAGQVKVALAIGGGNLRLLIEDDGGGIAAGAAEIFKRAGGGLPGIMRRANSSHGECSIATARGRGTRITVCWQLARFDTLAPESAAADAPLASVIAP